MHYLDVFGELAGTTVDLTIGFFILRPKLRQSALNRTIRESTPMVEQFEQNQSRFFDSTQGDASDVLKNLVEVIRTFEEARHTALKNTKDLKIPTTQEPQSPADIKKQLEKIELGLGKAVRKTYTHKIKHLVKDVARHRLMTMGELADAPAMLPLSGLEEKMVFALDQLGIIDLAALGDVIKDGLIKDHLVPEVAVNLVDDVSDLLVFPGTISAVRSVYKEIGMLMNDETDLGEVFTHSIMPAIMRGTFTGTGVAIDAAFGFMTCGLFTIAAYIGGKLLKDTVIKSELEEDIKNLTVFLDIIRQRKKQAANAISNSVAINFQVFPALIESCPDVAKDPGIAEFVDAVVKNYRVDIDRARQLLSRNHAEQLFLIPNPNWVDKILGICRPKAVESLYEQAANRITVRLEKQAAKIEELARKVTTEQSPAAEGLDYSSLFFPLSMRSRQRSSPTPLAEFINAIVECPIFCDGQAISILANGNNELKNILSSQYTHLQWWENDCLQAWNQGTTEVAKVSHAETIEVNALTQHWTPSMAPLRRRIRANLQRLRLNPDLCPSA